MEIKEIISACLKNEPTAQKQLVFHFSGKLMSVAFRYVPDSNLAQDIVQDAWIQIFKYLDDFRIHDGNFEAWIRRITVNCALKNLQKNKLKFTEITISSEQLFAINPEVFNSLSMEELHKMIQQLPNGCREIFNLYAMEEYQHKNIAKMLNISEGTSRSQYARARYLLMDKINALKKQETAIHGKF